MASRNGQSVYDQVTNSYPRTVIQPNGNSLGVIIPAEFVEENDIELGDDVALVPGEESEVLEMHFDPN